MPNPVNNNANNYQNDNSDLDSDDEPYFFEDTGSDSNNEN